jgi:hypothetical protein
MFVCYLYVKTKILFEFHDWLYAQWSSHYYSIWNFLGLLSCVRNLATACRINVQYGRKVCLCNRMLYALNFGRNYVAFVTLLQLVRQNYISFVSAIKDKPTELCFLPYFMPSYSKFVEKLVTYSTVSFNSYQQTASLSSHPWRTVQNYRWNKDNSVANREPPKRRKKIYVTKFAIFHIPYIELKQHL